MIVKNHVYLCTMFNTYENIGITKFSMTIEVQYFIPLRIVYRADDGILCVSGYHQDKNVMLCNGMKHLRITVFSMS
jgi:hypothetical protein